MIWFNNLIAHLLPFVPKVLVGIVAKQYIAGETLDQALEKIRELNHGDISATLDLLGEDPKQKNDCLTAVHVYKTAIQEIAAGKLKSGVSLKPTHMGLKLDKSFCLENLRGLIRHAREHHVFVRIDMEDASLKADTIDLYLTLKKEFDNVGIVMQAYLRSAIRDINQMIDHKANIRLCKGAYFWEEEKVAYKDMDIVNSSYVYLLEKLMSSQCFTGIATHDEKLVFDAMKIIDRLGLSTGNYEFQMLYGVQEDLRQIIHDQGYPVRVYVPFGKEWFAYSVRRLKENPKMISYILTSGLKNILKR